MDTAAAANNGMKLTKMSITPRVRNYVLPNHQGLTRENSNGMLAMYPQSREGVTGVESCVAIQSTD